MKPDKWGTILGNVSLTSYDLKQRFQVQIDILLLILYGNIDFMKANTFY